LKNDLIHDEHLYIVKVNIGLFVFTALQGPGFEPYNPTLICREDEYCCYFHHAVSKAPDLEAKCKAVCNVRI
jgi:hypothetical protein